MEMTACVQQYTCPIQNCNRLFYTVKLMMDHLAFSHDAPAYANLITCGIDNCLYKTNSIHGFRTHLRRNHEVDWNRGRYKRMADQGDGIEYQVSADDEEAEIDCEVNIGEINPDVLDNEEVRMSFEEIWKDYPEQLQKKLAIFCLKNREIHMLPKIAMESIMVDLRDILQLSHSVFARSFTHFSEIGATASEVEKECNGDILENFENFDLFLGEILKSIGNNYQLRNFCTRSLGMIIPRQIVLDNYQRNPTWFSGK